MRRPLVLVVDDEPAVRESVCKLLEASLRVKCQAASTGAEALELLSRPGVGVLVADFKMPGMSGLELMEKANRVAPGVPMILMTAFPEQDAVVRAMLDPRLEGFVTKPLAAERLVAAVDRAIQSRR